MSVKKEVTIYDLADELNISVATVSRALKDDPVVSKKTKKKIYELAEKRGYRTNYFARSLRKQVTNTIGFMIHELNSNFANSVLLGVEKVTTEAGYDLIIAHSSESYEKEVANAKNLFNKRVDGLIAALSFDTKNYDHFKWFSDKGVPVVFFDRVEQGNGNTVVVIDNYKCGYEATRHLIGQGCRHIAHVSSNLARNVYADRYRGYRDALRDAGLPFDENLVLIDNLSENAGIVSAKKILEMNPVPDGVFITNDFVAAAFIKTLKEHNVGVPGDIAVVGFNNDAIGHLIEPSLTTVNYPGIEMGEVAARALINHLKGTSDIKQIDTVIINSGLIIRQSSLKRTEL
ncbi:LacI family DNA-binding transcriptional regulator [Niabella beijingensis]|uniref:LacI family DNA-binding transcriptional regulator n=1 Tax=Niabella beijingensis TaxID=2872700 RepID=UPI001CBD0AD0|nr:LacI family DNA-binding transcriptional regulator [Niabella beijingensis]MBZ4191974.1 LacI family transcriptional regulator [Niabella beijingensis]